MFMACKYEEIYPFKLKLVYEKIAHKKIPQEDIRAQERDIMKTLNYDLSTSTSYEFMMNSLYLLELSKLLDEKYLKYLVKVCIYLSKMNQYDYELLQNQDHAVLAASTIYVAFKIIEQLKEDFPLEEKVIFCQFCQIYDFFRSKNCKKFSRSRTRSLLTARRKS